MIDTMEIIKACAERVETAAAESPSPKLGFWDFFLPNKAAEFGCTRLCSSLDNVFFFYNKVCNSP